MVGKAMFNTVLSSTTMSRLTIKLANMAHRRGCPSSVGTQLV
jgi:hypothetical protein